MTYETTNQGCYFQARFEHMLYGRVFEWVKAYDASLKSLKKEVQTFAEKLRQVFMERQAAWQNLVFPDTLFSKSVVAREDLITT